MNNFIEKLEKHIDESKLENNQKVLWRLFIEKSTQEEAEAVFGAVAENEENLNLLTKHLKGKVIDMYSLYR